MLLEFSVENFRSFRDRATLSMLADSCSENQESLIDGRFVPLAALFGPDGSGRSSILDALSSLVSFVSRPLLSLSSGIGELYQPYGGEGCPSFSLSYSSGCCIYSYSLSAGSSGLISESLEMKEEGDRKPSLLFSRTADDVRYHGRLRSIGADEVPDDVPLLAVLFSEHPDDPVVSGAMRGISDGFIKASSVPFDCSDGILCSIVRELGLGIEGIWDGNDGIILSYGSLEVPLSREGKGVQEIFSFLPSALRALRTGAVLLADDLLPSVHPAVTGYILRMFSDRASNTRGAALLLSSNALPLMDIRNFRRDEIWLLEKKGAVSSLSRLSSIRGSDGQSIRKDARFAKGYAEGAYGAYPRIGSLICWDREERRKDERRFFSINNRRYLGNKFRITRFIREIADTYCPDASSFADIFSGTGSVSYAFRDKRLILNDFLYSNYLANLAWFSPEEFDVGKTESLIDHYNALPDDIPQNYMSENFSGTYFSEDNCRRIGAIREDIESRYKKGEINLREKAILVTSLLYAMDRIAATCGHYDAWRRGADLSRPLELRMLDAENGNNSGNEIFSEDTNALVHHIAADIVYIDPPYNSRQYSDSYHLLENVARWEKPEVKGTARKMDRKGMKSLYSTSHAAAAFRDLVHSIDAKYILLSYNNMGEKGDSRSNAKITDSDLMSILSEKGDVTVFSTSHKAFSAGKSHIDGNEERVFLCRVRKHRRGGRLIESPLNYIGGKGRIMEDLLAAFPNGIDTFVDLFAGGCSVGINAPCRRVIFNDSDARLVSLLREMRRSGRDAFIGGVDSIIDEYHLSRSDEYGYAYYKADSSKGLGAVNKEAYMQLRSDFNSLAGTGPRRAWMLYVLIVYGFNNQIRFNDEGAFNLPVGKRDFNRKMREKLSLFIDRLHELDATILDSDFRTVVIPDGSFVYADPPYLITTATYNEKHGWTENDEKDLHNLLEDLDRRGIGFALSNTLRSRGRENSFLIQWLSQHPGYRVIHVERSYANSNYHLRDRDAESDEVIITNR